MSTENEDSIKVIVELHAKPGRGPELRNLLECVVAEYGLSQPGFLGSAGYEVIDTPDVLVEIANWESAEAWAAVMQQAMFDRFYAPLEELLAAPFRATVIRQLA
jgi:quinol monooxygenase YgiN